MTFLETNAYRANELAKRHPSLLGKTVDANDIRASANFLKENNFEMIEIFDRPKVLLMNPLTIANRIKVLNECCFKELRVLMLHRFVSLMNRTVHTLKAFTYIDEAMNVHEHLVKQLDVPIVMPTEINDNIALNLTRKAIIDGYLRARLDATDEDLEKTWKIYSFRLKHRNLESIVRVIDVLLNQLDFPKERILRNGFLLHSCPDNLIKIYTEVPIIAGVPTKELLLRKPKIAMQNAESIKSIINHVKEFGLPEDRIAKSFEILSLGADTVRERLVELTKVKEFHALMSNPRILRLIHFQTKAKTRLEYLKQLKLKCASLHVLSSSADSFEKYARDGIDKTKGKDAVNYLCKVFNKSNTEIRQELVRHPNWCHVPLLSIRSTIDYLRYKKFDDEEISNNLILLLYPKARIEQKLNSLLDWKAENGENRMISGVPLSAISNTKLLNLCLYFIESDFHFSGDGIWELNRHDNKDIFPTTIPEFPKTLIKYQGKFKCGVSRRSQQVKANVI